MSAVNYSGIGITIGFEASSPRETLTGRSSPLLLQKPRIDPTSCLTVQLLLPTLCNSPVQVASAASAGAVAHGGSDHRRAMQPELQPDQRTHGPS